MKKIVFIMAVISLFAGVSDQAWAQKKAKAAPMDSKLDSQYAKELKSISWRVQTLIALKENRQKDISKSDVKSLIKKIDKVKAFAENCKTVYKAEFGKESKWAFGDGMKGLRNPAVPCGAVKDLDSKLVVLLAVGVERALIAPRNEHKKAMERLVKHGASSVHDMARLSEFDSWADIIEKNLKKKYSQPGIDIGPVVDKKMVEFRKLNAGYADAVTAAKAMKRDKIKSASKDRKAKKAMKNVLRETKIDDVKVKKTSFTLTSKWDIIQNGYGIATHRKMYAVGAYKTKHEDFCRQVTYRLEQKYARRGKLGKNINVYLDSKSFKVVSCK